MNPSQNIIQPEVTESIAQAAERLEERRKEKNRVSAGSYPLARLRLALARLLKEKFGSEVAGELLVFNFPPAHVAADLALEAFPLAKMLARSPQEVAKELAGLLEQVAVVESAKVAGPFVNIVLKQEEAYRETLESARALFERYGESDKFSGWAAVLDYSAPNIAKPIGVGHLRSTIIGQALSNLYEATGWSVVRDNHLGDWGTQFGRLLYAYKTWGDETAIEKNPIRELKDLYVRFHSEADKNPALKDEARVLFRQLEASDPELLAVWKKFRDLSIADFERVYRRLGVTFDTYIGESFFLNDTGPIVRECLKKGICQKDPESGAVFVPEENDTPSFLVEKADGSSLYLTRDLATLKLRVEKFQPDAILYVVGAEQSLHFNQFFALAKKLGYLPEKVTAKHIDFGLVLADGKKMSTRKGTLIELEELMAQAVEKSRAIIQEKNPALSEKEIEEVAEIIGVGAIIYNDLRQSRQKDILFDWQRMLDFEAGSAAYLQYACVRISSILRKLGVEAEKEAASLPVDKISFEDESEFRLAKKLMFFPSVIERATATDSPHLVATYLEELVQNFSSFYEQVSVAKTADPPLRASRVLLVSSVATIIKKGLSLLNIRVPEKM